MTLFNYTKYGLNVMVATENKSHQLWLVVCGLRAFIVAVVLIFITLPILWFQCDEAGAWLRKMCNQLFLSSDFSVFVDDYQDVEDIHTHGDIDLANNPILDSYDNDFNSLYAIRDRYDKASSDYKMSSYPLPLPLLFVFLYRWQLKSTTTLSFEPLWQ